jgi:hypothetical protein
MILDGTVEDTEALGVAVDWGDPGAAPMEAEAEGATVLDCVPVL